VGKVDLNFPPPAQSALGNGAVRLAAEDGPADLNFLRPTALALDEVPVRLATKNKIAAGGRSRRPRHPAKGQERAKTAKKPRLT
jgi:hypothetical protein